jgi:hypothetical protein
MVSGLKVSSACTAMTHSKACVVTVLHVMSMPGSAASNLKAVGLGSSAMSGLSTDASASLTRGSTAAGGDASLTAVSKLPM